MPKCSNCPFSFPRLQEKTCAKCLARKPGLSAPELTAINLRPQCAGCSILYGGIESPICRKCIGFYKLQSEVPREICTLPGVAHLLAASSDDDLPSQAERSKNHSQSDSTPASDTRLTAGPPKTVLNTNASNKFINLSKANQVNSERRQKKAEAKLREEEQGVTIVATLWGYDEKSKLAEVKPGVHIRRTFDKKDEIKKCLDKLLEQVRADFEKTHPQADELTWENIMLLADCGTVNEWASLSHLDRSITVNEMFEEFRKQKYASDTLLKTSTIKIRFGIINIDGAEPSDIRFSSYLQSSVTTSKKSRKRARADSSLTSVPASASITRKNARPLASSSIHDSAQAKGFKHPPPVILRSAFKPPPAQQPAPPPQWARDPPMQKYSFTRINALVQDDGTVVVMQSKDDKVIEIATDWLVGEACSRTNEPYEATGYIGRGFTKRGIYARFGKKEFVLTQNFDEKSTEDEVKNNLFGEYKLLAMCHWFKTRFDEHARSLGATTIPKFYFNYPNSILGELKPSLSSTSTHVPFLHFIATPLLPCGTVDAKVKKFTGNEQFGEAPDDMTKAIHAFVHFSVAYSNDYILFCDLQGTLDSKGVMCLFDPQAHTNTTTTTHYWDLGSKAFLKVIAQHYDVCENNWVCKRLSLDNLKVEKVLQSPQQRNNNQASGRPRKPRQNRMNVISILNSDDE